MKKYFLKDIKEISLENYNRIFEINPDCKVIHHKYNTFEYWTIENFLLQPIAANEFILKNYVCIERDDKINPSYHPAKQMSFPQFTFYHIKEFLMETVIQQTILKKSYKDYIDKNLPDIEKKAMLDNTWDTYSNLACRNIKVYNRNNEPHTDPFILGCNLYLTDNAEGTALYKKKFKDVVVTSDIEGFALYGKEYINHMQRYFDERKNDTFVNDGWVNLTQNKDWEWYHTISGKFNSISMYRGSYYHAPVLSSKLEDDEIRHTLVFGYFASSPEEENFLYDIEVNKWKY